MLFLIEHRHRPADRLGFILRVCTCSLDLASSLTVGVYLNHFLKVDRVQSCLPAIIICVQPLCLLQTLDESHIEVVLLLVFELDPVTIIVLEHPRHGGETRWGSEQTEHST